MLKKIKHLFKKDEVFDEAYQTLLKKKNEREIAHSVGFNESVREVWLRSTRKKRKGEKLNEEEKKAVSLYCKFRRALQPEKHREYATRYYNKHKEEILEKQKADRLKNPQKYKDLYIKRQGHTKKGNCLSYYRKVLRSNGNFYSYLNMCLDTSDPQILGIEDYAIRYQTIVKRAVYLWCKNHAGKRKTLPLSRDVKCIVMQEIIDERAKSILIDKDYIIWKNRFGLDWVEVQMTKGMNEYRKSKEKGSS